MSKQIQGVPESITRQRYIDLIASIGLDARELYSLRFESDHIFAVVKARNANGQQYFDDGAANEVAKHHISIPVVDK